MAKSKFIERNQKITASRGKKWVEKLAQGKLDAILNPTKLRIQRVLKANPQEKIAKQLNISLSTYGAIERAKRKVNKETVKAIAKLLNTNEDLLFVPVKDSNKYIANR